MNVRVFLMEHLSKVVRGWRIRKLHAQGYKNISKKCVIERGVLLDKIKPSGIYIGEGCLIAAGTTILCHEHIYRDNNNPKIPFTTDTYIGKRCFVGVRALILPGVKIGDDCVIGAGCTVNKDIPSGCMAVGVPARIVKTGLKMNDRAELIIEKNMNKKKIYIAGCGGMLGEAFYQQFKDDYIIKCTDKDVNADWLSFLDFRDYDAYKKDVEEFKPDYLFHLGAYTDLEWCEQNADEVYLTNTLCVENAVYIANALDIPLLYISTAGIFDGKKQLYDDWDQPNPLGVYARSKYMGERFVVENAKRYLVCRAGWMMGAGPSKDKKFIQKIMKQLKDGKKELFIVNDKDGTPTYTQDFARTVKNLIQKEYWGLYNCVCGGQTSRLEVCEKLLKILGKQDEIKINVVTSEYFAKEYFADRPACERLWTRKLNIRGVNAMRDWKVSLKEYIDNYYKGYLD